jgi:hypothetical protein
MGATGPTGPTVPQVRWAYEVQRFTRSDWAGVSSNSKASKSIIGLDPLAPLDLLDPLDLSDPLDLLSSLEKRLETPASRRVTQLTQRLRLDLPDAFTGDGEALAYLFERML